LFGRVFWIEFNASLIPHDAHVRHVISDIRNRVGSCDAGNASDLGGDGFEAPLPFVVDPLRCPLAVKLEGSALENSGVGQDKGQNDPRNRRHPRHNIEGCGVGVLRFPAAGCNLSSLLLTRPE
jgi:hypothetical protein